MVMIKHDHVSGIGSYTYSAIIRPHERLQCQPTTTSSRDGCCSRQVPEPGGARLRRQRDGDQHNRPAMTFCAISPGVPLLTLCRTVGRWQVTMLLPGAYSPDPLAPKLVEEGGRLPPLAFVYGGSRDWMVRPRLGCSVLCSDPQHVAQHRTSDWHIFPTSLF